MKPKLEIACFNLESAIIAHQAGIDRIELCTNLTEGGTTPLWQTVIEATEQISTDIYVMIRPRGGGFCYNEPEFEEMKNDIVNLKKTGVQGFVFGILNKDNEIDIVRNQELVEFASPFPCTFHRAFDRTPDIFNALESIIDIGFQTVLTSGGEMDAFQGAKNLRKLVNQANNRISILVGGGVRSANIGKIWQKTNAQYFHSSAILENPSIADLGEINNLKKILGTINNNPAPKE